METSCPQMDIVWCSQYNTLISCGTNGVIYNWNVDKILEVASPAPEASPVRYLVRKSLTS